MGTHIASAVRVLAASGLAVAGLLAGSAAEAECPGENVCLGTNALESVTTGEDNVALGRNAMRWTTTGSGNIAIGNGALTDNYVFNGTGNGAIAIGNFALARRNFGSDNIAIGREAMFDNSENSVSGGDNIAIGANSLLHLSLGTENVALGVNALNGAKSTSRGLTASYNVAVGGMALYGLRNGDNNTAVGYNALAEIFSGYRNTATGTDALANTTTGFRNVAVGNQAGMNVTTGSDNIILGAYNLGAASEVGAIRIGNKAYQKKAYIAGISGVKTGLATAKPVFVDANGQLGTVKSSARYKEDIHSMGSASERLMALRPVTFRYKEHEEDGSQPVQFGLIAEEVAEVFPELVVNDLEGEPETVRYDLLATLLVNEFQKQGQAAERLAARVEYLEGELNRLAGRPAEDQAAPAGELQP